MTVQSIATMTVAASGPNSRTDANTKASETEMRAATEGIFTENDPVKNVNAARISHCVETGCVAMRKTEYAIAARPVAVTRSTYP